MVIPLMPSHGPFMLLGFREVRVKVGLEVEFGDICSLPKLQH